MDILVQVLHGSLLANLAYRDLNTSGHFHPEFAYKDHPSGSVSWFKNESNQAVRAKKSYLQHCAVTHGDSQPLPGESPCLSRAQTPPVFTSLESWMCHCYGHVMVTTTEITAMLIQCLPMGFEPRLTTKLVFKMNIMNIIQHRR